jgi:hypothetical protein
VKRDEWQRKLLSSSTDDEEIREAKRMKSEEEDCMRFKESRGWTAEAYPTRGMEVRDRASENVDRKQGEEKELTGELVTDKVIMALVLLEERTCSMGERLQWIESKISRLNNIKDTSSPVGGRQRTARSEAQSSKVHNGKNNSGSGNIRVGDTSPAYGTRDTHGGREDGLRGGVHGKGGMELSKGQKLTLLRTARHA